MANLARDMWRLVSLAIIVSISFVRPSDEVMWFLIVLCAVCLLICVLALKSTASDKTLKSSHPSLFSYLKTFTGIILTIGAVTNLVTLILDTTSFVATSNEVLLASAKYSLVLLIGWVMYIVGSYISTFKPSAQAE